MVFAFVQMVQKAVEVVEGEAMRRKDAYTAAALHGLVQQGSTRTEYSVYEGGCGDGW